jgi:lipoprotein-releasing system permease protein
MLTDFDTVAAKVRQVPGVVSATPMIEGQVMATGESGAASGAIVRGIRPDDIRNRALIAGHIVAGSLAEFGDDGVALGERLARRLGAGVGAPVTLISPQGTDTAFGTMPRLKTYRVAALFNVGFYEYDNSFIYVPLRSAQIFFRMPEAVTDLEVFVDDADQVGRIGRQIAAVLGGRVRVIDWMQANSTLVNAVEIERNVMFLILTLIILVAAFNIVSSLTMLVKDKGRDIAILRTMGAARGAILRIFLLCGAAVGGVGTLAGFGIGLLFCANIESIRQGLMAVTGTTVFDPEIYFLTRIPAVVDPAEVAQVVGLGLLLSLLATLIPSWRAAQLDPVEALRNE